MTHLSAEVAPKRLELAHELVPKATVFALLVNPTNSAQTDILTKASQGAAETLGLKLDILHASTEAELDDAFAAFRTCRPAHSSWATDSFFSGQSENLAALALRHAVPAIYEYRPFVAAGGLASYGGSITDAYRLAGVYTGRILKGVKPADLPVQQSTKVELLINLKTAKTLGLTLPLSLLGRADEVIE